MNDPVSVVFVTILTLYVGKLWVADFRRNVPLSEKEFPGTGKCSGKLVGVGILAGLLLLACETFGESLLGVSSEQSTIKFYSLAALLSAAFYEELIFRGYFVVNRFGRNASIGFAVLFSVIFAILHPFIWNFEIGENAAVYEIAKWGWTWDFSLKALFSTGMKFVFSLSLYFLRLGTFNKDGSLLPCIAAHGVFNLGVYLIKLFQGFVAF